ncbi:unnamed protein product [Pleuronectes platessa]|uniref:Uncharacterized protein n=1 Tax=Pleuronectes platessa TaxID=8262 RepID=A0A9N7Z0M7_PLEPL|nr:unnamed protein product [Pleuronectes platessa]
MSASSTRSSLSSPPRSSPGAPAAAGLKQMYDVTSFVSSWSLRDSKCAKRSNMCDVQLLRVSVHERISAAAEDFLLQVEKGGETAHVPALRAMLNERLTAAAKEIVSVFEKTVAVYEDRRERVYWSEQDISLQRRRVDAVMKPELQLHRVGKSLEEPLTG